MKNKRKNLVFALVASLLTMIAVSTSVSACFVNIYQPEEPKCLREE